jgi:hypothetical protein
LRIVVRTAATAYRDPFQNVAVVVERSKVCDTTVPFRTNRYPSIPG